MVDRIDAARRSLNMSRVRSSNTKPEMAVRRATHKLGCRFRLRRKDLPGTPDLVFPARRLAVFVHGCFWHRHDGCARTTVPATRTEFWLRKFDENKNRDQRVAGALLALGWTVAVVWECETYDQHHMEQRLRTILTSPQTSPASKRSRK